MNSTALTKARFGVVAVLATATLAATGVTMSLAVAQSRTADPTVGSTTGAPATHPARATKQKQSSSTQGFTPAPRPQATTTPAHTKTKGS
jgi:hypothetical protein